MTLRNDVMAARRSCLALRKESKGIARSSVFKQLAFACRLRMARLKTYRLMAQLWNDRPDVDCRLFGLALKSRICLQDACLRASNMQDTNATGWFSQHMIDEFLAILADGFFQQFT